jgi:hypothetical protein
LISLQITLRVQRTGKQLTAAVLASDAVGVRLTDLPITGEAVLRALRKI